MTTLTYSERLVVDKCISCGVAFAWPEDLRQYKLDHRHGYDNSFFCPNGHSQHFTGKTEAEIEREARIRAEARAARMEDKAEVAERRRRAAKGQLTKTLKRVENGVCPHCKRTFADLARHMESKHAESKVGG